MDKLLVYIENRIRKYGHAKGEQAICSNYYFFGKTIVRVSDHIKYGEDSVKKFNFCFIIQPNDTYIFTMSPKVDNGMGRMYLKIVSLKEAKDFIRKLHDHTISVDNMTEIYNPNGWNRKLTSPIIKKLSWDDFNDKYLKEKSDEVKMRILNIIELVVFGKHIKGKLEQKLDRSPEIYMSASDIQYETIINKVEKSISSKK